MTAQAMDTRAGCLDTETSLRRLRAQGVAKGGEATEEPPKRVERVQAARPAAFPAENRPSPTTR